MNHIEIKPCSISGFSNVLPILETHVEAFDYAAKHRIIQQANKSIEQDPQHPPVFLASHEGIIIGFIGLQIDAEDPGLAELFGQAVKHGYQGQGIGTKLLQTGVEYIKTRGSNQISLQLKASMPPYVNHFYQKAGFKLSFDENYTGASDENHTLVLTLKSTQPAQQSFYPE
jgi:ribosomal protein S18 acetylase RimI-like enzyme